MDLAAHQLVTRADFPKESHAVKRTRILVAVSAAMFAVFGLLGLSSPQRVLDMIHAQAQDATALNEVRAMQGGFELGVAAFLVACLMNRWSLRAGLFLTTAIFVGAASARAKSMAIDGMPDPLFVQIWIFELVFAAVCVATLVREKD